MREAQETAAIDAAGVRPGTAAAANTTGGWEAELDASTDAGFFPVWLQRQCDALAGARAGLVLRASQNGLVPAASWPASRPPSSELSRVAERAATAIRPVIAWARRPAGKSGFDLLIGAGIRVHGALAAVIAVSVDVPGGIESVDPDALAAQLIMGAGWLDARLSRGQARGAVARIERASIAMDIVAVASLSRRPARAAAAVVNELAIKLRCDRVSLGLVRRGGIKLKALSHVASFQERGRVVDAIENAMEECLAQTAAIAYPPVPMTRGRVSVAHRDLSMLNPSSTVTASVVLPSPGGAVGVLTFERKADEPFDDDALRLAEAAGALLGPVLRIQTNNDRIVAGRILDTVHDGVLALVGREKPSLKLAAIGVVLIAAILSVARGEFRVTARAVLEGRVQRAAVVPFDGFIATSPVRPGDRLHAGDLLAAMDDHDLILERTRAWADVEKARQKYDEAMAKHDRPNAAMLAAEIDQGEAQLALADDKLKRSQIVSPIDGLLVSGDLSQMLGTPVERGKTLFEIAPLDDYRIVLRTDERDLRFVSVGQHGQLALAGMPGDPRRFTVTRVTPIAEAKDGRNEFRVEATWMMSPARICGPGWRGSRRSKRGRII